MSETTEIRERASLECGWCGDVAIYGDENGLFGEDDGERCLSCGWPGHVEVEDDDFAEDGDSPAFRAYWAAHADDDATVAKWEREYPEEAARMARETADAQERWAKKYPELALRASR